MIRLGPSGNSVSFYNQGYKHTYQAAEWIHDLGLNAFEYSFGRGVKMGDETAGKIRDAFAKYNVSISAHAPYYTNFSNESPDMIAKSRGYIAQSIDAIKRMGGERVVFHPASCGKQLRADAVELARRNIAEMMENLEGEFILCPETMGKFNQIGTVEEVVDFCKLDSRLIPCIDFGHVNSYLLGGIKSKDDYKRIVDHIFTELGEKKAKMIHIHFSKIMYGAKGELKHLTFADDIYGPTYDALAEVIDEYGMSPYIVCESDGTMAEDALTMKSMHRG